MISSAGAVRPLSYIGTYSVNADCTGTGTIQLPTGGVHTSMALAHGGDEFIIIVTDQGAALSGVAHRQ